MGDDDQATNDGRLMAAEAAEYVQSFRWCAGVSESYVAFAIPPVFGVFLVRIEPLEGADPWLWILLGDIPPAYIHWEPGFTGNPASAIDGYIGAMTDWVDAVEAGESVDHLIPVNAAAEREFAAKLRTRLAFLDEHVLGPVRGDLSGPEERRP